MLYKRTDDTVLKTLETIDFGSIRITLHDGRTYRFQGKDSGPMADLSIHAPDVLWNMAVGGDTAFARDYQAGKWDSDDIASLVDFAFRNDAALGGLEHEGELTRLLSVFVITHFFGYPLGEHVASHSVPFRKLHPS